MSPSRVKRYPGTYGKAGGGLGVGVEGLQALVVQVLVSGV